MKYRIGGDAWDFQAGDKLKDFRGVTKAIVKEYDTNPGVLYLEFLDKSGREIYLGEPGEVVVVALRAVSTTLKCIW